MRDVLYKIKWSLLDLSFSLSGAERVRIQKDMNIRYCIRHRKGDISFCQEGYRMIGSEMN